MDELVTVIVPVYNVENYLRDCVESIRSQEYQNIEIILIDDGSTDNSGKICDEYMIIDSRIKVLHKKNGGLSDARNTGLKVATGDYIVLVDSDDMITSDYVKSLLSLQKKYNSDIVACQWQPIDEDGNVIHFNRNIVERNIEGNSQCMRDFLSSNGIETCAWGKLYKSKLFREIRYPYGKYHEDIYTTYLLISKCSNIYVSNKRYYLYRHRKESIMNQNFSIKHLDAVDGNLERRDFIEKEYPELVGYANSGVVYAANQCAYKMMRTSVVDKKYVMYLQENYRKYEKDFLHANSSIKAKIFSVCAFVNVRILVAIGRFVLQVITTRE